MSIVGISRIKLYSFFQSNIHTFNRLKCRQYCWLQICWSTFPYLECVLNNFMALMSEEGHTLHITTVTSSAPLKQDPAIKVLYLFGARVCHILLLQLISVYSHTYRLPISSRVTNFIWIKMYKKAFLRKKKGYSVRAWWSQKALIIMYWVDVLNFCTSQSPYIHVVKHKPENNDIRFIQTDCCENLQMGF